jgi:hypothetical protein
MNTALPVQANAARLRATNPGSGSGVGSHFGPQTLF